MTKARVAGHYGAALKQAAELGLPPVFVAQILSEHSDLSGSNSSPVLLAGVTGGVDVSRGDSLSVTGGKNSGEISLA